VGVGGTYLLLSKARGTVGDGGSLPSSVATSTLFSIPCMITPGEIQAFPSSLPSLPSTTDMRRQQAAARWSRTCGRQPDVMRCTSERPHGARSESGTRCLEARVQPVVLSERRRKADAQNCCDEDDCTALYLGSAMQSRPQCTCEACEAAHGDGGPAGTSTLQGC
jgi:hypothetical protein